jgi:hypothetical protein
LRRGFCDEERRKIMAQKHGSSLSEKAKLEKKIAEYSQYQWLTLMPAWMPGVLSVINPTPTVPGREFYVLLFHVGSLVFGIGCFVLVRAKIKNMKARLARLENPDSIAPTNAPPIPDPKGR